MSEREHPFYDQWICREREQEFIRKLLHRYRHEPVSDALKKKVYDDLAREKTAGNITIPFRVVVRRDAYGKYPPCIEVILDTKV